jgi:hypothetical protein
VAFRKSDLLVGLDLIELAAAARPDWLLARRALANALLRSAKWHRALAEYQALIGPDRAEALAAGTSAVGDLESPIDPVDVLGLACAEEGLGHGRRADRLYRAYADLVGPETPAAAIAYSRLAYMFDSAQVPWGDAGAERAKALALDPAIEDRNTLPPFTDPASIEDLEPYTRKIALAPGHEEPENGYDALPVLIRWRPPEKALPLGSPLRRTAAVDVLVDVEGVPSEVLLPESLDPTRGSGAAVEAAVLGWRFEPARSRREPAPAWITIEVGLPNVLPAAGSQEETASAEAGEAFAAPPDTVAPAAPDTVGTPPELLTQ